MIQIVLYVALTGVAVFLYALTRPKQNSNNTDAKAQQRLEYLLQKVGQEQVVITESINKKLNALHLRMDQLEEKVQQHDEYLKQLKKDDSFSSVDFDNVTSFNPKHMQVVYLLKLGKDEREIARQTGAGIGEIELLRRLLQQNQGEIL